MQPIFGKTSRVAWVLVWLGLLAAGFLLANQPAAVAAPPNQTIPPRTATAPATAVPTVTPTSQSATSTPVPPTATSPAGGPTNTPQPGAPTATPTPEPTSTTQAAATPLPGFALAGQMGADSPLAMAGGQVVLRLVISNPGPEAARNVTVRDELPGALALVSAEAVGGTSATETGGGRTVVLLNWPELAPGAEVQAVLTVQVSPSVADGTVIDNLAVAYADNAGPVTMGVSLGTPPVLLPTFD